jgi:uncharacterized protein YxeA
MKKILVLVLGLLLFCAGCAFAWATIIATAEAIAQLVVAIDPDAVKVAKISQIAVTGLEAVEATYNSYEADKTGVGKLAAFQAAVEAVQQNLPADLAAAQITNPTTKARVTAAVNIILDYVDALAGQVPSMAQKTAALRGIRGAGAIPKVMSKRQIIDQWKSEVCNGDKTCAQLVQ